MFTRLQSHAAPYSSIAGFEKVIGAERVAPVVHDDVDLHFCGALGDGQLRDCAFAGAHEQDGVR
jgi:hypothetical protein